MWNKEVSALGAGGSQAERGSTADKDQLRVKIAAESRGLQAGC